MTGSLPKSKIIICCITFLFIYAIFLALNEVDPPGKQHDVLIPIISTKGLQNHGAVNKNNIEGNAVGKNNEHGCQQWFGNTFGENLRVISEYPRGDVSKMLKQIKGNRDYPETILTSFPVIVTAANAGYYEVAQGLLQSIHEIVLPKYKEIKIIFYDLGLTVAQREELKLYCRCDVRKFPFEDYPNHTKRLKSYAWKPVIIQTLLMEFGWVWWMDASIRFITPELDKPLQYSIDNHVLFFTYTNILNIAYHTDVQMMRYLKEDPCKFRQFGEIESGFVLYHYDDITSVIVEAMCACALSADCITPPGAKLGCNIHDERDGRCHRYDQAILSILLRRLFHEQNDYPLVETPFKLHEVKRGNIVKYFQSLKES